MRIDELREKYLQFFKQKEHAIIPSASLVPEHDPTVLFTTAGMHPLVPYLLGQKHPMGRRLANCQKCIRTTDIEEVSDPSHLTFFEMLGNWSLGDYWKEETIRWSFEFLTSKEWLGLDPQRLSVTLFAGDKDAPRDEESARIWKEMGIPEERIYFLPKKDNWWGPAGITGPCGPCTEMFMEVDNVPKCGPECMPGCNCGHYFEIWNDVFMEYNKEQDGSYSKLEQRNVDTGMGVERTAAMLQGVSTVYELENFTPIVDKTKNLSQRDLNESDKHEVRVVADHVKAATMIMADDRKIAPSNTEHGYVVRRLLRRAILSADRLELRRGFMEDIAQMVIDVYRDVYEEVERNRGFVMENLRREEKKFKRTLRRALRKLERILDDTGDITGEDAFLLFTSYGLPIEITREIAQERGLKIDMDEFREEFEHHREVSRAESQGKFKGGLADHSEAITKLHTATHLLQEALRRVLGNTVKQMGSNITKERLRFDFSFNRKLTPDEIESVEKLVNDVIERDMKVKHEFMSYDEAIERGALAFFKENYGDEVSVYSVGDFSMELCGGPHVDHTAVLGRFKIKKQENIGSGIMRIRAVLE